MLEELINLFTLGSALFSARRGGSASILPFHLPIKRTRSSKAGSIENSETEEVQEEVGRCMLGYGQSSGLLVEEEEEKDVGFLALNMRCINQSPQQA